MDDDRMSLPVKGSRCFRGVLRPLPRGDLGLGGEQRAADPGRGRRFGIDADGGRSAL